MKTFKAFQEKIGQIYGEKDLARGPDGIMTRLVEELGELAKAMRIQDRENQKKELGDLMTWIASLASSLGVTLEEAVQPYREACPYCGQIPCAQYCEQLPRDGASRSSGLSP